MEYPFKDLLPLDEVLAREGYYKDWTHIDADTFHQISELVKFIREKGYGSDTREAIAQALERVYHDAIKSGNADMEVSLARKHFEDLASRLDASDDKLTSATAQLASIVSGTPKGTYANLQALEDAHPNGEEGVFLVLSDGHWYYWDNTTSLWTDGGVYQSTQSSEFPATNIATNGNFSNGTTGWLGAQGSITAENNELIYTVTATDPNARVDRNKDDTAPNHKYYVKGEILPKYNNATYFEIGGSNSSGHSIIANQWNKLSAIIVSQNNSRFRFRHRTNVNYSVGDIIKFENIVVIDLTKVFGAGSEPSRNEMDEILSKYPNSYFEGTVAPLLSNKDIYLDFVGYMTENNEIWGG